MGVAVAEAGVEFGALVGDLIPVRVFEKPDVRSGGNDHAVFVENETRGQLQLVRENMLLVHAPVAVGVGEDADPVERIALILAGLYGTAVFPNIRVRLAQAVGILGRLHDPHPPLIVPVDVHRLVDERLGGHQGNIELRVQLDLRGSFLRARRAADRVAEGALHLFPVGEEHIRILRFPRPSDPAQEDGLQGNVGEILIHVPGDACEGAALAGLVSPDLRLDIVNVHRLAHAG